MNRLPDVKRGKAFRPLDLIFYALILALIAVLLLFTLWPSKGGAVGFSVKYEGKTVYTYRFEGGGEAVEGELTISETERDGRLLVRFSKGEEYNLVEFDPEGRTARVLDANCSARADCAHMPAIGESGTILCVPHALSVEPLTEDLFRPSL